MPKIKDPSPVHIYGLFHPATGELFYIGRAKNIMQRISGHLANAKAVIEHPMTYGTTLGYCLLGMLLEGVVPEVDILETVPAEPQETWQEAEEWNIEYYRSIGCTLVNSRRGGTNKYRNGGRKDHVAELKNYITSNIAQFLPPDTTLVSTQDAQILNTIKSALGKEVADVA